MSLFDWNHPHSGKGNGKRCPAEVNVNKLPFSESLQIAHGEAIGGGTIFSVQRPLDNVRLLTDTVQDLYVNRLDSTQCGYIAAQSATYGRLRLFRIRREFDSDRTVPIFFD